MSWLFLFVEAALVLAALAFYLIAAFLAPAHHETFATLASPRLFDLAIVVALAMISLGAAIAVELLRRKMRRTQRPAAASSGLPDRLSQRKRDAESTAPQTQIPP